MTGNVKNPEAMYDIWAYPVGGQRKNQLLRRASVFNALAFLINKSLITMKISIFIIKSIEKIINCYIIKFKFIKYIDVRLDDV
ncbi:MAG: hypothetical protein LLF98_14670 [Clostridium sp.]|uniref:hypothetical protein n=1 Tax=Clostridium sp. TaxID=1506 RepID=UPI0025B8785E|nr:hypothetical protein [Clostridium sp.]MCE5222438.1 hypothetical protein [Clostridium sp.]